MGDRAARLESEDWLWAWLEVDEQVEDGDCVQLLIDLAEAAPNAEALARLGAGAVESALTLRWADLGGPLEVAIRQHPSLREAAAAAWFDHHIPARDAERLRALVGPCP